MEFLRRALPQLGAETCAKQQFRRRNPRIIERGLTRRRRRATMAIQRINGIGEPPRHRPASDAWPANMDRGAIVAVATNAVPADVAADLAHTSGLPLERVSPAGFPVVLG